MTYIRKASAVKKITEIETMLTAAKAAWELAVAGMRGPLAELQEAFDERAEMDPIPDEWENVIGAPEEILGTLDEIENAIEDIENGISTVKDELG